jgi:putative transcriptional regulator
VADSADTWVISGVRHPFVTRILFCFLLLLGAACSPASADDAPPVTTILLVARPALTDPNFKDSLVLVMNNVAPAPAGVILNRPTRIPVSKLFADMKGLAKVEDKLYFGGPVASELASFVFRSDSIPEHATRVIEGVYFSTDRELLLKLLARDNPMEGLRIFIGFSGWAPGQLEAEIERGDWTLAPAGGDAIFGHKSEHPWPERTPDDTRRS